MDARENEPLIDFSNTDDLKRIEGELVTIEGWAQTQIDIEGLGGGLGYHTGQQHMVTLLEHLINLKLPFEEMKQQLTGLVQERKKFLEYALDNSD